jgi:uncharacterized membrane protein YgcG
MMEQSHVLAALALDFIQQLPAQQSESAAPFSGVLSKHTKLFQPEIEKFQGQITSHASGDFIVVFPKPFSAAICAMSLHRMFGTLSQALPELEHIQLRIGVHAETSQRDEPQAQQNLIDKAHVLKELVPGGRIFVSTTLASAIDKTVDLKPAGEHKLAPAAEPLNIFELILPPIRPLQTERRFHLLRLSLPLVAVLALAIIWSTPLERVRQQFQFLFQSTQSFGTPKTPAREGMDRRAATLSPADKLEESAPVQPPSTNAPPGVHPPQSETIDQKQSGTTEAQARQTPSAPRSDQVTPNAPKGFPSGKARVSVAIAAREPHQVQQVPQSAPLSNVVISIPKPRPRPAQHPQLAVQQTDTAPPAEANQTTPSLATESTEGPISILPKIPIEQNANLAAVANDCEFLRQAFDRGTLVPSADQDAYKHFLRCRHERVYSNREKPERLGDSSANRQRDDGGAASGGDSGSNGSSGPGGRSNGRGNSKGK